MTLIDQITQMLGDRAYLLLILGILGGIMVSRYYGRELNAIARGLGKLGDGVANTFVYIVESYSRSFKPAKIWLIPSINYSLSCSMLILINTQIESFWLGLGLLVLYLIPAYMGLHFSMKVMAEAYKLTPEPTS